MVAEEKMFQPDVIRRSVVDTPTTESIPPSDPSFVLLVASAADGMIPWGQNPHHRDQQLRAFVPTESWFASALSTVCARNASFSWTLAGPDALVQAGQEMLLNANRGRGWQSLVLQTSMDLYTQDRGAFIEVIRTADTPASPCINLAHLDAGRCFPTGNPEKPVVYMDRYGRLHVLKWYQVIQLHEMPSGIEQRVAGVFYELQYSAATRLLRSAQILKNIAQYKDEKTAGRFVRAIHLLRGVSQEQVQDAIEQQTIQADQVGVLRYLQPLMVSSVDPSADVGHDTIELAALPDNFDEETTMKWYIAAMALAFLVDYQEFAPLPGGGLGTSNQSAVLHAKSRGKGPGLFQKLWSHMLNFQGVLPRSLTFEWDEQDIEADKSMAELEKARAEGRAVRIASGEIDEQAARDIAVQKGDLTQEQYDALAERDEQRQEQDALDRQREDANRREEMQIRFGGGDETAPDDRRAGSPVDSGGSDDDITVSDEARKATYPRGRMAAERRLQETVGAAFDDAWAAAESRLRGGKANTAQRRKRVVTRFQRDGRGYVVGAEQEERWAD